MSIFDIAGCEEKIGYTFKDKILLRQCFTHSSFANEYGGDNNELLEFFGDSVIQFVVTEHLFKNGKGDEGKMTQKRAEMVSKAPLLDIVKNMGLGAFVLMGKGQEKTSTQAEKLFSSIYEALVAGIYIDGGMVSAKAFVKRTLIDYLEGKKKKTVTKKAVVGGKNLFQEYVQKNKLGSIAYETMSKRGPDHNPEFRVAALLNGKKIAEGKGGSKKEAETKAAEKALKSITKQGGKRK